MRAAASLLTLSMMLAACGGHSSIPAAGAGSDTSLGNAVGTSAVSAFSQHVEPGNVPHGRGIFAFSDQGRRPATSPVRVTVTLAYNHQAELDQLVANQSNPSSPMYQHYLSNEQFNSYYAPTAQQQQAVEQALLSAGFQVSQQYDNRTLIDATAPSAVVEHFFNTEIHNVSEGQFGQRFTNVKTAALPTTIASYVKDVTMNNLIFVKTRAHVISPASADVLGVQTLGVVDARHYSKGAIQTPGAFQRRTESFSPFASNIVTNPGFETGAVNSGWIQCGNVTAAVVTTHPHAGSYDEHSGKTSGEVNGDTGVCQQVTKAIPATHGRKRICSIRAVRASSTSTRRRPTWPAGCRNPTTSALMQAKRSTCTLAFTVMVTPASPPSSSSMT